MKNSARRTIPNLIRHTRFVTSIAKPKQEIIDRLRQRLDAQAARASMRRSWEEGGDGKEEQEEAGKKEAQVELQRAIPERRAVTRRQLTDQLKDVIQIREENSWKRGRFESCPEKASVPNAKCTNIGSMTGFSSGTSCKQNSTTKAAREGAAIGRLLQLGTPRRP